MVCEDYAIVACIKKSTKNRQKNILEINPKMRCLFHPKMVQKSIKNVSKIDQKSIQKWMMVKKSSWKRLERDFGRVPGVTDNIDNGMLNYPQARPLPGLAIIHI